MLETLNSIFMEGGVKTKFGKMASILMAVIFITIFASSVQALPYYSGSLNVSGEGIIASAGWAINNATLSWVVEGLDNGGGPILWRYDYTFNTNSDKDISHIIFEVSTNAIESDFTILSGSNIEVMQYTDDGSNSNPNMPGVIYGMKLDPSIKTPNFKFSFTTTRSPVWGDFYAKDGSDNTGSEKIEVTAWNAGFLTLDPLGPAGNGSINYHLLVAPIPIPLLLPFPNLPLCFSWALAVVLWEPELDA